MESVANIKDQNGNNLVNAACNSQNLRLIDFLIDEKKIAVSDSQIR